LGSAFLPLIVLLLAFQAASTNATLDLRPSHIVTSVWKAVLVF